MQCQMSYPVWGQVLLTELQPLICPVMQILWPQLQLPFSSDCHETSRTLLPLSGPGCSKLMKLSVNVLLKFQKLIFDNGQYFLVKKNVKNLALQKLFSFFQQK